MKADGVEIQEGSKIAGFKRVQFPTHSHLLRRLHRLQDLNSTGSLNSFPPFTHMCLCPACQKLSICLSKSVNSHS